MEKRGICPDLWTFDIGEKTRFFVYSIQWTMYKYVKILRANL